MIKYCIKIKDGNISILDDIKKKYFEMMPNNIILLKQSVLQGSITFVSVSNVSNFVIENYVTPYNNSIDIDKNYINENWNFTSNENICFKLNYLILKGFSITIQDKQYWDTPKESQDYTIMGIFNAVACLNRLGIGHGYLSFLSNLKYFTSQITAIYKKEQSDTIKRELFSIPQNYKNYIKDDTSPNIDNLFYKYVKMAYVYLEENCKQLIFSELPQPENFFQNSNIPLKYSHFHKCFYNNPLLIRKYKRYDFLIYRIVMGTTFSLLPLLQVSLLRRNKIININSKKIQRYYYITWKTQFLESVSIEKKGNYAIKKNK